MNTAKFRFWLIASLLFCVGFLEVRAASFGLKPVPTFTFSESYTDVATLDGSEKTKNTVTMTAVVPIVGLDLATINGSTPFEIVMGDLFSETFTLSDDPNYDPGELTATFPLEGYDFEDWDLQQKGSITLTWSATSLTVSVSFKMEDGERSPHGWYYADTDATDIDDEVDCRLVFGDCVLERAAYVTGWAKTTYDGINDLTLSSVLLNGTIDSTPPNVAISFPKAAQKVYSPTIEIKGSARDDKAGIEKVMVSVNGAPYVDAVSSDGFQTWSFPGAVIKPGTNNVKVKALDINGVSSNSISGINALNFDYPKTGTLTVTVSGSGSVNSLLGTTTQTTGTQLTIKAVPAFGYQFGSWTGLVSSTSSKLTFTMVPNSNLQANFVPGPFHQTAGTYNGLISGTTALESGKLKLNVNIGGAFTGKLKLAGAKYPISGTFNSSGNFSGQLQVLGKLPINLSLQVNTARFDQKITGTAIHSGTAYPLSADRLVWSATTNPAPQAGDYTVIFPLNSGTTSPSIPQGDGFARVAVTTAGSVTMVGTLADGTEFSTAGALTKDGVWPFYVNLYAKQGLISGTMTFRKQPGVSNLDGTMRWIKSPTPTVYYPNAFSLALDVVGSKYVPPAFFRGNVTAGNLALGEGGLAAPLTNTFLVGANNAVTITPGGIPQLNLVLTGSTGLYRGAFFDSAAGTTRKFKGAVLQIQNKGAGFFLSGSTSGYVDLGAGVP